MTRAEMDQQLGRLVVLKGMPGETDDYFGALQDIPADLFTGAVNHALKTRTWFPVPAELRADCDAVVTRVRVLEPVVPHVDDLPVGRSVEILNPFGGPPIHLIVTRDWHRDCETCADTGWSSRWCGDGAPEDSTRLHCERRFEHGPHEWVERCHCVEWNPTIKRRKEAMLKYAQAPEKVNA